MRYHEVFVAAAASRLPARETVADAVADGRCDARVARSTGLVSVSVANGEHPAEMAARAAATALRASGHDPGEIDLILHADVYYQGQDLWPPAAYVQRVAVGNRCPAVEVRQMSNGGMVALELAAGYLSGTGGTAALLTTGDRFAAPGFDRWRSDAGTLYADGGTALVLSRRGGFAVLRALATVADSDLESMHRGDDPFGTAPFSRRPRVDLDAHKRDFVAAYGLSFSLERVTAAQNEVLKQVLADAGCELHDIDHFVLPHFGLRRLTTGYLRRWGIDAESSTWPWARTVGHLGAGDQYASLAYLAGTGRLRPGQRVLLAGVGAGFTWTLAVLDILTTPDAATAPPPTPEPRGGQPDEH
ncbi:ketoacyl-ACP synthase III family protein [Candidatus Protofrankia californiensis]|uniref:ketoacyl-ACP synthase III family protein n=1 Tax=Candidatus Protofrankia californiensis TaxID=1839754 RepID=UPI001041349E|nr:ketoacyl-ACP synthase III family protein [Candidatus Protofrankia californiensis]